MHTPIVKSALEHDFVMQHALWLWTMAESDVHHLPFVHARIAHLYELWRDARLSDGRDETSINYKLGCLCIETMLESHSTSSVCFLCINGCLQQKEWAGDLSIEKALSRLMWSGEFQFNYIKLARRPTRSLPSIIKVGEIALHPTENNQTLEKDNWFWIWGVRGLRQKFSLLCSSQNALVRS